VKGLRIIPTRLHGILDYSVGVLLIASPWIFGFSDVSRAKWTMIAVGAVIIGTAMTTNYELGLVHLIPMHVHLAMDSMIGLFLAASPWILGYADEGVNAWAPPLVIGLMEIGAAAVSRPWPERSDLARREEQSFKHAARA
jgi:SPW repeat-containing protein